MSRPLLETTVRKRVMALKNVHIQAGHKVLGLITSPDKKQVTGVQVRNRGGGSPAETLTADLVVDATGRVSKSPQWLETIGYGKPPESIVKIDVGYATRIYRRDEKLLLHALGIMTTADPSHNLRGGVLGILEGERWIVTLFGWLGDHPPLEEQGFLQFASSLAVPDIHQVIKSAEPLGDIAIHKLPSNLRRHYERMERFPEGYLILGDAMCSFNPIYGQGMSVAAMQADVLGRCLEDAAQHGTLQGIARTYFRHAAAAVKNPWMLAVGEDFRFAGVESAKTTATDQISRFVLAVIRTAHHNREVARIFFQVINLLHQPTRLFSPDVVLPIIWQKVKQVRKLNNAMQPSMRKVKDN
jgi:2-polyprenyl-6-methoxyphenol hydroxylase-like FAD-dependent oxidoreductase